MLARLNRGATVGAIVVLLTAVLSPVIAAPASAHEAATAPTPTSTTEAGPTRPFGSHLVELAAGAALPPGGVAAADADTAAAYTAWKAKYVKAGCGTGRYYVDASSSTGSMVVSEGQGYGMVVTALLAGHDPSARAVFDGLFRYVDDHPSEVDPELMAWHQKPDCTSIPGDAGSATDGDLDIAFALLLADTQWGSAGAVDYAAEAATLIAAIERSEFNPSTHLPLLGDWPAPGDGYWFATRTSDLMIDHFRAFGDATGDPFWSDAIAAAGSLITTMQATHAPATGLLPDFVVGTDTATPAPAPPQFLEAATDGDFSWNACRTPWRLASAAMIAGDAVSLAAADRMRDWVVQATTGDPAAVRAGYRLDGTPLVAYGDQAFLAPMAAVAAPHLDRQAWVDRAWSTLRSAPSGGYYADSIRLQVMLLVSGNSWLPSAEPVTGVDRIGGADRFAVSAAVSAANFAPATDTVYVASGEVFPDALSASAAAGAAGGPVLLVLKNGIPAPVAAELTRLGPQHIVVLGGPNTVSAAVVDALRGYAGDVRRIGGADRFAVSAAVSADAFDPGLERVYVASGEVFPDALSGSAAAGHAGAPVLLVGKDGIPPAIDAELRRLDPGGIVLLGGTNSVSAATASALAAFGPVTRVTGADRYTVAAAVSARAFPAAAHGTVFVASGQTFPDALSGAAAAIGRAAPVLLVARDTLPGSVASELDRLAPQRIVLLGGPDSVSGAVATALATHLSP
ncbi:glycosyl hydrolase family 8 [Herbiconiux ginsengi]|uniref:Glucanase n=1 Tax=Herbiconiux ginsengi TaxID=381665 RepID=A0A1H3JQ17_9MICO|nr:glycosyl hydrolase family 8 [Herbiconiux ginsengi]SDY41364.1 Endo-1,4-beta-D-glucanase Y [Herbiconiux ginsengi]